MKTSKKERIAPTYALYVCLGLILLVSFLLSLRYGGSHMTFGVFFRGLFGVDGYETENIIIWELRFPRALGAILCGVGLSVSGALLQTVTDNSLAGPNIIGVNTGAGFFTVIALALFPTLTLSLPLFSFLGAFLATLLIVLLAGKRSLSKGTVILAGIALNALLNAGISFITLWDTDALASYNSFSVGGLRGVTLEGLIIPAALILICLTLCMIFAKRIDVLCLGDYYGASFGVNVRVIRLICIISASALAGAVVSFCGLVGFVGLVSPHISRFFVGGRLKRLLPFSALIGAITVLLADLLGRILLSPSEIPVGIMMAFIGAPFFIVILIKNRGGVGNGY